MDIQLIEKKKLAIWIAKSLFERGKTAGSTANLSFKHKDRIYITGSGTCFANLTEDSFSELDIEGNHISGIKASKEFTLHKTLYKKSDSINAVIHTHSFYSTVWSCLDHKNEKDCIPTYTPYLKMKVGTIGLIPYEKPGSEELFSAFEKNVKDSDGYILKNHGPIIGDKDLMSAFYALEELEESARVAWTLRNEDIPTI